MLFRPCLCFLFGDLFLGTSSPEDIWQRVVPLVTGVFVEPPIALQNRNDRSPGLRPCRRIIDRKPVVDSVSVDARKPFRQSQVSGREHTSIESVPEVGCLNNQRLAFPMAPRISEPLSNTRLKMGPAVKRNNLTVGLFMKNDHMISRLEDLEVERKSKEEVYGLRNHWRPALQEHDAAVVQAAVVP